MSLEVADHTVDGQRLVVAHEPVGSLADHSFGHVERDVARQRPGAPHRVKQDSRLQRSARAELDQLAGAGQFDDLVRA